MKKNISLIVCLLIVQYFLFSCKKVLDTSPEDFLAANQYFNTDADLKAAIGGVYSSLAQDGTYGRNLVLELEMGNDEAHYNNRNNNNTVPALYDCQASTKIYADCWTALYQGIGRANLLLANIDQSKASIENKTSIKGEALFLRAFNYFQLVTRFGEVPLLLTPTTQVTNPNYSRTPSIEVYNQILADMKAAELLVKDITAWGNGSRISKTAVQGIIARVYLKMAGSPLQQGAPAFDSARQYALKVINSGIHALNPSYKQVFINHSQDLYDYKESMWEIEFKGNNVPQGAVPPGSRFASQLAMRYTGSDPNPAIIYGYGSFVPTGVLYNIYATYPSDTLRRNWNLPEFTYNTNTTPRTTTPITSGALTFERDCGKWKRDAETVIPKQRDWGPTNFPVLRYADVLLMAAEAENEVNGPAAALQYINMVRARSLATPIFPVQASTQAALRQIIQDERARELCFEALRKFDLIRWGIFNSRMDFTKNAISNSNASTTNKTRFLGAYLNVKLRDTLLPIPSVETSVNSLITQNAGW
jgi:starch-binding outer membrane protein, SusD/RagB family